MHDGVRERGSGGVGGGKGKLFEEGGGFDGFYTVTLCGADEVVGGFWVVGGYG